MTLDLTAHDAACVLDHLFDLEMSWQGGNTALQTVFLCLYLHPEALAMLREYVGWAPTAAAEVSPVPGGEDAPAAVPARLAAAGVTSVPAPGSVRHTAALCVLAYATALLRTLSFIPNAIFSGAMIVEVCVAFACCCVCTRVRAVHAAGLLFVWSVGGARRNTST